MLLNRHMDVVAWSLSHLHEFETNPERGSLSGPVGLEKLCRLAVVEPPTSVHEVVRCQRQFGTYSQPSHQIVPKSVHAVIGLRLSPNASTRPKS